jgi:bacillolysin
MKTIRPCRLFRRQLTASLALICLGSVAPLSAQNKPLPQQIAELLQSAQPVVPNASAQAGAPPAESARASFTTNGYLSYLGAPPSHQFPVTNAAPGLPELTARHFLRDHAVLFGISSQWVDFAHLKSKTRGGRHYVRLQQTFATVPVFAAQAIVQVSALDGVECVLSDIETDTSDLDNQRPPLAPSLTANAAKATVRRLFVDKMAGGDLAITDPILTIFSPTILGATGAKRLVWDMKVTSRNRGSINDQILLDAHAGSIVRQYPLCRPALDRRVRDSSGTSADPGTLVREEGGPPCGIQEADDAYDLFGDAYSFYSVQHGRDSIDNSGVPLRATVRFRGTESWQWGNAWWDSSNERIYFDTSMVADDILAHEYTHGVTDHESDLVYENESGAINESFSDVWGEFIDLSNGWGNDSAGVRWSIGEDWGAFRNMRDPTLLGDPDRKYSPLYVAPTNDPNSDNDYGGVHSNCGVNNKLCYLITDGTNWNNQDIFGMGIARVADLYYEVNANLLSSGAGWWSLYDALTQAAINLGWTVAERNNLYRACVAVEINRYPRNIYVDKNNNCLFPNGTESCVVYGGPYLTVAEGLSAASPGDNLYIFPGTYRETVTFEKIMTIRAYSGAVTIGQ